MRFLSATFQRANRQYFEDRQARPRLLWSGTFTSRKFGHYDLAHDTVMLSTTLGQFAGDH